MKKNQKIKDFKYVVVESGCVTKEEIYKALELDRLFYKIPCNEQFDIEKCVSWNKKTNNQIYTMVKDSVSGDIIGYINAAPINNKCYEEIKSGQYPDAEINDNDIVAFEGPNIHKHYNLYFASIVIDTSKDGFIRFKNLYDAFLDKLINFTKQNIIISRIIADAVSDEGKRMCMLSGMKKIKDTEHDSSCVFEFELFPPTFTPRTPKQKELYNILMEKYNEFKTMK